MTLHQSQGQSSSGGGGFGLFKLEGIEYFLFSLLLILNMYKFSLSTQTLSGLDIRPRRLSCSLFIVSSIISCCHLVAKSVHSCHLFLGRSRKHVFMFFLLSNAPILANFISPSKRKGYYLQSDGSLELVVWKCRFLASAVLLATELTLATRSLQPSIVPYIGFTPTQHVTATLLEYPHEKKNRKRTEEI